MAFDAIEFWLFLPAALLLFYLPPFRIGKVALIVMSCVFYAAWNPKYLVLLAIPTIIDYLTGLWLEREVRPGVRRAALIFSVGTNLGLLAFFKYFNFFVDNVSWLFGTLPPRGLQFALPVGISFYTFNTISYVVDVYRRRLSAVRNPSDFALFIVFFPHLVAGPIVRAADFIPQIRSWKAPEGRMVAQGVALIGIGLVKKMVCADQFALAADRYFGDIPAFPGALSATTGVFAFSMQIFFDFSGYTDMARGLAKLFGFDFQLNFARPYLSLSITEFWRRWHISLSAFLRDYLYVPLGGNRGGPLAQYNNLMITMLLGGLWHGASWNFVVWGGLHGAYLVFHKMWMGSRFVAALRSPGFNWAWKPCAWALTFTVASLTWIFFRARSFTDAAAIFRNLSVWRGTQESMIGPVHLFLVAISLVGALLSEREFRSGTGADLALPCGWRGVACVLAALLLLEFGSVLDAQIPFIYFQF